MTKLVVNFYSLIGYEIAIFKNWVFFVRGGVGEKGAATSSISHVRTIIKLKNKL